MSNDGHGGVIVRKAQAAALFTVITALPLRIDAASRADVEVYLSQPGTSDSHEAASHSGELQLRLMAVAEPGREVGPHQYRHRRRHV